MSLNLAPALESSNFRLFWVAQLLSTIGTSLQVVAEGWLIYRLTESTFWLGAVGFMALLPVLPLSFLGGVLIDRWPRRRLILVTQTGLLVQAALFGWLAVSGRITLSHVILLYFIFGSLLAIDHPARRAFLVDLVSEAQLPNAVALNATLFNVSSLVGYALSGFLIAQVGAGGVMLLNAVSYIFPIIALSLIRLADVGQDTLRPGLNIALWEGLTTLYHRPEIVTVMALMAVVGGLANPIFGLMPAFAETVVKTDAVGLGLLFASGAVGSLLGTGLVAQGGDSGRGRKLGLAGLLLPLLVMGVGGSGRLGPACLLVMGVGAALLIVQSLAITLVQLNIPGRVRGRVMSLYSILHAGSDSGGNLVVGTIATWIGLPLALTAGGIVALLVAIILHSRIRQLE